jgi:hypothetical protein
MWISLIVIGICALGFCVTKLIECKDAREAGVKLEQEAPYKIESPEVNFIPSPFSDDKRKNDWDWK